MVVQAFQIAQVLSLHTFGLVTLTIGTGIRLDKSVIHIVGRLEQLEQELKTSHWRFHSHHSQVSQAYGIPGELPASQRDPSHLDQEALDS